MLGIYRDEKGEADELQLMFQGRQTDLYIPRKNLLGIRISSSLLSVATDKIKRGKHNSLDFFNGVNKT